MILARSTSRHSMLRLLTHSKSVCRSLIETG
ncbi:MAG: hypothetical protein [Podoviridae sp. cty5g4]|nr:MAG: hypothetical protein [Podoviridae sp. cty5g4]